MLYLLVHEPYKYTYSWDTRKKLIFAEARKKRHQVVEIDSLDQISADDPQPLLCLRSAAKYWIKAMVKQANARNLPTVVMTNLPADHGLDCSVISDDLDQGTQLAIDYLRSLGKKSIALFGVNPSVYSDPYRAKIFREYLGVDQGIYTMDHSFTQTCAEFIRDIDQYDSVLICNSATAVALSLYLKDYLAQHPDFYLMSFGSLSLSNYFHPSITTVKGDISSVSQILFSVYDMIGKYDQVTAVDVRTKVGLSVRESTRNRPMGADYTAPVRECRDQEYNPYLQDDHISEVIAVESMLLRCDKTDLDILFGILEKKSYQELSEQCFLSTTAIKYRVKQLEKKCQKTSLPALRALIKKYFT